MNDCPNADVRDRLPDLVHDRLSPAARAEVESHVAGCADCREEVALLRDLRASIRRTPVVDVSAIAAVVPAYRVPVKRHSWVGWQAAAAITILAAGGTSAIVLRARTTLPIDTVAVVVPGPTVSAPAPLPLRTAAPSAPSSSGVTAVAPSTVRPTSPSTAPVAPTPATKPPTQAAVVRGRELAMAGSSMNDLSDGELAKLLRDIDKMDAVPLTDVESDATTPRVPPRIAP